MKIQERASRRLLLSTKMQQFDSVPSQFLQVQNRVVTLTGTNGAILTADGDTFTLKFT